MARVLGLDLGSYAVKGLVIETGRTAAVKAFASERVAEGPRAEAHRAALTKLLANATLHADQVVAALPGPSLATHQLSLPFLDAKRIDAAIAFQVEDQLPFDLADAVFDYQIAEQKNGKSDLLVGVVRKEEMRALLELLAASGVDPRIVSHPGLVYQPLFSAAGFFPAADEPCALVDIGHERTTVAVGRPGGGVEFARTFPGGGRDLSKALANEFQIAFDEANRWKEENGAVASEVRGPDAERAAAAFVRGLQPILRELRSTMKAFSARSRRQVGRVYLCGGTSRLRGLGEQLGADLGIATERLPMPTELRSLSQDAEVAVAQPYALAMRGAATGPKAPRFNLRRGDFAFKGHFDYVKDRIGLLASFAAAIVILLVASGIVKDSVLSRREQQVDQAICDITQRVLGSCEKNYDRALNMLRGKESPAAVIPKLSAVGLLAELTDRIPADTPVTFDQIVVDLDRVTLRGETESSKAVDKITTALKAYRCFHEVKQGKVEKSKNAGKVIFNLDIEVQCPEQAGAAGQG